MAALPSEQVRMVRMHASFDFECKDITICLPALDSNVRMIRMHASFKLECKDINVYMLALNSNVRVYTYACQL